MASSEVKCARETNANRSLWDTIEALLLEPWVGGIAGVLAVLAGALASFFTDAIKENYLPWPLAHSSLISFKATSFWTAIFSLGLLINGTQWARNRAAERARNRVDSQVKSLESLVKRLESLPPESFLADYQEAFRSATKSTLAAIAGQANLEQLEQAIRNVLGAVLELAVRYDKSNSAATYSANVMIFKPSGKTECKDPHSVLPITAGHPDYEGCLELIPAMTTATSQTEFGPDPAAFSFVLPIPKDKEPAHDKELNARYPALPGAPWAFVYKEYAGFSTIGKLSEWLDQKSSADTKTKTAIRTYFSSGQGKQIQSFVSMPLIDVSPKAADIRPIGVLNLHSDRNGLLEEKGGERFGPILEPFRMILSILLKLREEQYNISLSAKKGDQ